MKVLYTGATKFEAEQKLPEASLGNYISSTEVPNGLLSNIFDTISRYTVKLNKAEIRVIAIQNDDLTTLTGLKAWFEYPNSADSTPGDTNDAYMKIGVAAVKVDDCGDLYIDKIGSSYAVPYSVTLYEADAEENALNLPDLTANGYLIIYLQRILDPITQVVPTSDELEAILNGTTILPTTEEVQLIFSWN